MSEPIKSKRLSNLAGAPTPQNTPATVASSLMSGRASQPSVSTIREEGSGAPSASDRRAAAAAFANNPALLSMIEGKLGSLVGRSSGYIESLPRSVKDRLSSLHKLQSDYEDTEAEFQKELLALEKRYAEKYAPIFTHRAKIINGLVEPSPEEIEAGKAIEEEQERADEEEEEEEQEGEQEQQGKESGAKKDDLVEEEEEGEDIKGIPQFWLTALKNLPAVSETITDRDESALEHLRDIRMNYLDTPGFSLVFEFDNENPFFTNKTLTKTYYYRDQPNKSGDYIYNRAEGTEIDWQPGKNITVVVEKRKQRNKHTKATRTIEKTIPVDSFFLFFSPPISEPEDQEEEEEQDPEEALQLRERLEIDYHLGEEIKDKLIPYAVDWYTGAALDYEDFGEDDFEDYEDEDEDQDEEDEDEDDEDEDDDDDDDDDDQDDNSKSRQKRGGASSSSKNSAQEPSECKQS